MNSLLCLVHDIHTHYFDDGSYDIILCGSATLEDTDNLDDLDYLLVVQEITPDTMRHSAYARHAIEEKVHVVMSNTIVTYDDIAHFNTRFELMDFKAVQAILQMRQEDTTLNLHYNAKPRLSSREIKQFSKCNYYVLRNMIRKMIIRNRHSLDTCGSKLVKLWAITEKLKLQYVHPFCFVNTGSESRRKLLREVYLQKTDTIKAEIRNGNSSLIEHAITEALDDSCFTEQVRELFSKRALGDDKVVSEDKRQLSVYS